MMDDTEKTEKTWREWDKTIDDGIRILDPDGFERGDPMMNMYVYTRSEFLRRRTHCTVVSGKDSKGWGIE